MHTVQFPSQSGTERRQRTARRRLLASALLVGAISFSPSVRAQSDRWAGTWSGTHATREGGSASVALTIVQIGGVYTGVITGFSGSGEIRLSNVTTHEGELTIRSRTETDFGPLSFVYALTRADDTLSGDGHIAVGAYEFDVSLELVRERRSDVIQPQIEQRIEYFSGEWAFEYTGGEFPPLSVGTRTGVVRFSQQTDAPFVQGEVTGDIFGDRYEESWVIGFDDATQSVVWREQLSNGHELLSLGNWESPIGITFLTVPLQSDGHIYVLQRLMRVTSDTAFSITDQFSVDDGPFRRLGSGSFIRTNSMRR